MAQKAIETLREGSIHYHSVMVVGSYAAVRWVTWKRDHSDGIIITTVIDLVTLTTGFGLFVCSDVKYSVLFQVY